MDFFLLKQFRRVLESDLDWILLLVLDELLHLSVTALVYSSDEQGWWNEPHELVGKDGSDRGPKSVVAVVIAISFGFLFLFWTGPQSTTSRKADSSNLSSVANTLSGLCIAGVEVCRVSPYRLGETVVQKYLKKPYSGLCIEVKFRTLTWYIITGVPGDSGPGPALADRSGWPQQPWHGKGRTVAHCSCPVLLQLPQDCSLRGRRSIG